MAMYESATTHESKTASCCDTLVISSEAVPHESSIPDVAPPASPSSAVPGSVSSLHNFRSCSSFFVWNRQNISMAIRQRNEERSTLE